MTMQKLLIKYKIFTQHIYPLFNILDYHFYKSLSRYYVIYNIVLASAFDMKIFQDKCSPERNEKCITIPLFDSNIL
jgi:hypothetical protein